METNNNTKISIEATVKVPVQKAWELWTTPEHIMKWNSASDDWHTPKSENDLRKGGSFSSTMAAKDGSFSFDFGGVYDEVDTNEYIAYTLGDGRQVSVTFTGDNNETKISETFDPESQNPTEMQRQGWQAILNNFKKYAEEQQSGSN